MVNHSPSVCLVLVGMIQTQTQGSDSLPPAPSDDCLRVEVVHGRPFVIKVMWRTGARPAGDGSIRAVCRSGLYLLA